MARSRAAYAGRSASSAARVEPVDGGLAPDVLGAADLGIAPAANAPGSKPSGLATAGAAHAVRRSAAAVKKITSRVIGHPSRSRIRDEYTGDSQEVPVSICLPAVDEIGQRQNLRFAQFQIRHLCVWFGSPRILEPGDQEGARERTPGQIWSGAEAAPALRLHLGAGLADGGVSMTDDTTFGDEECLSVRDAHIRQFLSGRRRGVAQGKESNHAEDDGDRRQGGRPSNAFSHQ